ncbi:hypothetical protein M9H77_20594 [Catharanthus roseus]|uniref:Uncharacterized protein n=1 Tax=Catharanthus roseus TaxID=4058 RepID=A0ACC0AKM2_CATRO|nr:hypothetical protein M9H77_20594 [Catharanthus roseus]
MRQLARAQMVPDAVDTRLDLHRIQLRGNDNTSWVTQHAIHLDAWNQWRRRVRDDPAVVAKALSYLSDEYIRCLPEVDDMTSVVIREPPSSPSQMTVVMKKVQTIIRRYMVSIGGTLGCTPSQHDIQQMFPVQLSRRRPWEHVLDRGARGVKRGARRHPGHGVGGGRPSIPPAPVRLEHVNPGHAVVERGEGSGSGQLTGDPFGSPNLDMPSFSLDLTSASQSLPSGSGTSQMPPAGGLGFASFQSPHSTAYRFSGFRAPPPLGTASSSTPHWPISQASSSEENERQEDMDGVQRLCSSHHPTGLSYNYYFIVFIASYM